MKKTVGQIKNGLPGVGQDKDTMTAVQRVSNKASAVMTGLKGKQLLKVQNMLPFQRYNNIYDFFYRVYSQKVAG